MYNKRIKAFIAICALGLAVCLLRLVEMQLFPDSQIQEAIDQLKQRRSTTQQLDTLRGKILDRNGRVLATDEAQFQLQISYNLCRFGDPRVLQARRLQAIASDAPGEKRARTLEQIEARAEELDQILAKCARFTEDPNLPYRRADQINQSIWNLRTFLAWVRSGADPNLLARYDNQITSVPLGEAKESLARRFPDPNERLLRILRIDNIPEMSSMRPLLELKSADDIFAAQLEFADLNDVEISPRAQRTYPYGSSAAQVIGWVGPATQDHDTQLFAGRRLMSYLQGEVCGREDGIEYVCETVLRGSRGEVIHDIDERLADRTETEFGRDVRLTLDIELQQRIEELLQDEQRNLNYRLPSAAVVLDAVSGDVLVMVSLPSYDLNRARYDYGDLTDPNKEPNRPLINRAINRHYSPGSVVKPVILIAGLESERITPDEVIGCPGRPARPGWPNCWVFNQARIGHDGYWSNNARNAVRGSCNIYFAQLADRLESVVLQSWLFQFGYGRQAPLRCPQRLIPGFHPRILRQAPGRIATSSLAMHSPVTAFEQIPPLRAGQKRLFGIGHGDMKATVLQVANSFATIARGGIHKPPRLVLEPRPDRADGDGQILPEPQSAPVQLQISSDTMAVVCDGLNAVVNKVHGTAYDPFVNAGFARRDVQVLGKTGSTEQPDENAWFGGFAQDSRGRKVALALVIEGGKSGTRHAAPLARDILLFCVEAGYVGQAVATDPLP